MTTRTLELNLRARADTKDLEKLERELTGVVGALRRTGAAFDAAEKEARGLVQVFSALTAEEQKQVRAAAQTAAAVDRAAAARERAASAASNAAAAEARSVTAQQASERAAIQTATAQERLAQSRANAATSVSRASAAEEKLAQERHKTYQATARSEKAEYDVARAREQLRAATARAEQAERRMAESRKSTGLATDIVRKQLTALVTGGMAVAAGRQLVQFGRDSVTAASDAEEASAKFQQVFQNLSEGVNKDLAAMADANRRSIYDLRDYASELQNTFVPLGFAREQAADFAKTITQLGIDIAAFANKADADVIHNLTSALVGNHEAVRSYGIVLTQTVLNQELARMGALNLAGAQLETAKAQARLNIIMRSTADAQGAAVREADSYSNVLKAWDAAVVELQVALGQGLLPTMTELVEVAIQAAEVLKASGAFQEPFEAALENAKSVEEIVAIVREARADLNDLDFWDWFKVNLTDFPGLSMAEKQIQAIAKMSSDVTQFQRTAMQEFSRFEISSAANALGIDDQSWDLEQTTADIYAYVQALRAKEQAERDAAEMEAAYQRERKAIFDAQAQMAQDDIVPTWITDTQTQAVMDAWGAWADDLNAVAEATQKAANAQAVWNASFGQAFQSAPIDDLIQAQQELRDSSGEWAEVTVNRAGEIGRIQAQLAADLTNEQKSQLQKQLKDLDEFSSEYMAIVAQLEGDLSDSKRFDLLQELTKLEGQHGGSARVYSGDIDAAEEAQRAIQDANRAIVQSHYDRAYNSIAAVAIEAGEFDKLADLAVSLGIMTREEADLRLEYAATSAALDQLLALTTFYTLAAGDQAGAVRGLASGFFETADAALQAAQNAEAARKAATDFYNSRPDSQQIGQYYQQLADGATPEGGITATVGVVIDPAASSEFLGFRSDLEEYGTAIYETSVTADYGTTVDDFEKMRGQLDDLTKSTWVIKVKYETEGGVGGGGGGDTSTPPGAPEYNSRTDRNRAGAYVDLTVNNYGGGDVAGAVRTGVMAAFRSLG